MDSAVLMKGRVHVGDRRYRVDAERIRRNYEGSTLVVRPLRPGDVSPGAEQIEVWSPDGVNYLSRATLDMPRG